MTLRTFIPWLIGSTCAALIAFTALSLALKTAQNGGNVAPEETVSKASSETSGTTLEHQILSLFSIEPAGKKSTKLVAAMIENHVDARRYQQGLHNAAAVFEMIVEGDISRFLALFTADRLPERIGPIRSLRPHFINAIEGYRPLLLHAGGSALAYQALETHPEILHHDGIRYDGETYERDPSVPAPHNLFMSREKLLPFLERLESSLKEIPLPLFDVGTDICRGVACYAPTANTIEVSFGDPLHDVRFTYDPTKAHYVRAMSGAPEQSFPNTILILETEVQGYGIRDAIPWTKTYGFGKMLLFREGKKWEGTWSRKKGEAFSFKDHSGTPLTLSSGQVWIMLLPNLDMVTWHEEP